MLVAMTLPGSLTCGKANIWLRTAGRVGGTSVSERRDAGDRPPFDLAAAAGHDRDYQAGGPCRGPPGCSNAPG
jgi:hypothetical protein